MNWQVGDTVTVVPVSFGVINLFASLPVTYAAYLIPQSGGAPITLGATVSPDTANPNTAYVRFAPSDVATPGSFYLKVTATFPNGLTAGPAAIPFIIQGQTVTQPATWATSYLKVTNGQLTRAGQPYAMYGATMYPYYATGGTHHFGSAWADSGFAAAYIPTIISYCQALGLNTIRLTDYLAEGNGALYNDATVWSNIDSAIAQFKAAGIMVILDFSEFRNYIINKNGVSDPYSSTAVTTYWQPMLTFALNRYLTETNIAYYAIAGEVPQIGASNSAANAAEYTSFFTSVSAYIKGIDSNHLVSSGGFNHLDQDSYLIPWQTIFALANIDIAAVHAYQDRDRYVSLPAVATYVAGLNPTKPLILEEYGFQQNLGDSQRAYAFQNEIQMARNCGCQGIIFWNLANHVTGGTEYDVDPTNYPLTDAVIKAMVLQA